MMLRYWPVKYLRCSKKIRNLYRMPNNNDKTDYSPEQLREIAARIHACAAEFEKTASEVESWPEKSIALATDTFLKTLDRLESFRRTIDRETISIKAKNMAAKGKKRVSTAREKK